MDDIVPLRVKTRCDGSCDRPIAILRQAIGYDETTFSQGVADQPPKS